MNPREQSFTLIELIIVVVIIGIMAGVGIPSYQKAIKKNEERTAIVKLQTIRAGMIIYKAKYGNYPAFDMPDLTSINQNLGLSVIPDTMTYQCVGDGVTNVCEAISPDGWIIRWADPSASGVIHCSVNPCPSCQAEPAGCGAG